VAVHLSADGSAPAAELERLTERAAAAAVGLPEIVTLVHGFNTPPTAGEEQYRRIARTLRAEARAAELGPLLVVGVHWPSYPGPLSRWLPQMVAFRATAQLGLSNAVRNPYLRKAELAQEVGRRGLRAVLLRLGEVLPGCRRHVFAHSLGSEATVRALAPERPVPAEDGPAGFPPPVRPELRLDLAVLAGADLDEDVFARDEDPTPRLALPRARYWWLTVARQETADAALDLRRGAGRRDAIGNRGLTLWREDCDALLARRGLILDDDHVPVTHSFIAYFSPARLRELVAVLAYLRDPRSPAGRLSTPAALDPATGRLPHCKATRRLYDEWRARPEGRAFGRVRLRRED